MNNIELSSDSDSSNEVYNINNKRISDSENRNISDSENNNIVYN